MEDKFGAVEKPTWSGKVWNRWTPNKINVFMWKCFLGRLPTLPNLLVRKVLHEEDSTTCKLCEDDAEESIVHLFFKCSFAKKVWEQLGLWLRTSWAWTFSDNLLSSLEIFEKLVPKKLREIWQIFWNGVFWFVWVSRNEKFFKGGEVTVRE